MVDTKNLAGFVKNTIDRTTEFSDLEVQKIELPHTQIRLRTNHPEFKKYCSDRLIHSSSDQSKKTFDIYLCSPDTCSIPEPPQWTGEIYSQSEIEKKLLATPYRASYYPDDRQWHLFDSEREIGLQWMKSLDAYPPWEAAAPLRIFLHWIYSKTNNRRLLHAGSLGKNGKGILFAGNGGAGKSGTVAAGIMNGLQSVGDDYILCEEQLHSIIAKPLFSTLKQDAKGITRLGLNNEIIQNRTSNWQQKYEFTAQDIGGLDFVEHLELRAVFTPRIASKNKTTITPLSKAKAMLALAPSGAFQMPDDRAISLKFAASIVRKLPCYRIELGSDPNEITDAIYQYLEHGLD